MSLMLMMFGSIPDRALAPMYSLPFNARQLEETGQITIDPEYGYEFSHTLEEQIAGQLRAGFAMIDFMNLKTVAIA